MIYLFIGTSFIYTERIPFQVYLTRLLFKDPWSIQPNDCLLKAILYKYSEKAERVNMCFFEGPMVFDLFRSVYLSLNAHGCNLNVLALSSADKPFSKNV